MAICQFALAQQGRPTPNNGAPDAQRAVATNDELLEKVKRLEEQVSRLAADKERLSTDKERLTSEKERATSGNERLNADNTALRQSQAKSQNEIEKLRQSSKELEEDNRQLRLRVGSLSEENASLQRKSYESSTELSKFTATVADLNRRNRELDTANRGAEMEIQKLEQASEGGHAAIRDLAAKVSFFRTLSTIVTVGAVGILLGIAWRLRTSKRDPTQHLQREIGLKSRPDAFSQLGCSVEKTWSRMKPGQPWQDSWVALMRDALATIVEPGTLESRTDAAAFIVNTWIRFVAQFEPDTVNWQWTRSTVERAVPQSMRVEIDVPPSVGISLAGVKNDVDEIHGTGNIVREVLCPGRRVLDLNDTVIAQGGAVIRVGE
jgi:outer membrane murein-binding lipoprotein Lpp